MNLIKDVQEEAIGILTSNTSSVGETMNFHHVCRQNISLVIPQLLKISQAMDFHNTHSKKTHFCEVWTVNYKRQ